MLTFFEQFIVRASILFTARNALHSQTCAQTVHDSSFCVKFLTCEILLLHDIFAGCRVLGMDSFMNITHFVRMRVSILLRWSGQALV